MGMAKSLVQQITTDAGGFAIPVIYLVTNGITTTFATCNSVVILHGLYIDKEGTVMVAPTSRIMVSEPALIALSFPTRDTNNKLALKGTAITFTDSITGLQVTFVIKMAIGNDMTGMVSCTLEQSGTMTPAGRLIIGWLQSSITANIVASLPTPNPTQTLANGDVIVTDYVLNADRTLTIPYMVGYSALSSFFLIGREIQDIIYTKSTGKFSNAAHGGFNIGDAIKFDASIPIWKS